MKIIRNNKLFPSLNIIDGKSSPNGSKGIIIHYHYRSDPILGPGIFAIRIITCSCYACRKILSVSCDQKTKEAFNQPRYSRVYNFKYSKIIGCQNNWIIMIFFDDETDEEYCKHINQNILDVNVMNMSLIVMEGNYGDIYSDNSSCHGYYIIIIFHIHIPFKKT